MDLSNLTTMITTVGFPIVAYGGMFWYMVESNKRHQEEVGSLTKALENNTIALTKLQDSIGGDSK